MIPFDFFRPCGDPLCSCAVQPVNLTPGLFDATVTLASELSESGYEKLDSAIDVALEEASDRGFEEGYDKGYDSGFFDGVNTGAREAFATAAFEDAQGGVGVPSDTPRDLAGDFDALAKELDLWAPQVDAFKDDVALWASGVDQGLITVDARIDTSMELVATILEQQTGLIERLVDAVKDHQEKTDADALYLDTVGKRSELIDRRLDRLEDATGVRAFVL